MTNNQLKQLRNRIDEINLQLLELLNERTELVEAIGQEKDRQGLKKYDHSNDDLQPLTKDSRIKKSRKFLPCFSAS